MTRKEREKDEQVLAAILTAAATSGREVRPHFTRDGVDGSHKGYGANVTGPCCAVGAGVIYAGLEVRDGFVNGEVAAIAAFAKAHDVSTYYSHGVSAGFENLSSYRDQYSADVMARGRTEQQILDFARGYAVGEAAFQALHGQVEP